MGTPTRFPNGLSLNKVGSPLGNLPLPFPNPNSIFIIFDDFDVWTTSKYTITGAGTKVLSAVLPNGVLTAATSTAQNDVTGLGAGPGGSLPIAITPGKQTWFSCKLGIGDVANTSTIFGLADSADNAQTNGLYFSVAQTTGVVSLVSMVASAATTLVANCGTFTSSATVQQTYSFYYDGRPTPTLYIWIDTGSGDTIVTSLSNPTLPTALCSPSVVHKKLDAAATARVNYYDFILGAQEVVR